MRKICSICHQSFVLNAEEEEQEGQSYIDELRKYVNEEL